MSVPSYVMQFAALNFTIEVVGTSSVTYRNVTVDGIAVTGITVSKSVSFASLVWTTTFTVTGAFQEDIATNNEFITVKESNLSERTYNDYDIMMADYKNTWDLIRRYAPDASPTKTASFNFTHSVAPITLTIYTVPDRWYSRLQTICQLRRPARTISNSSGNTISY